jgi:hypothetical protein
MYSTLANPEGVNIVLSCRPTPVEKFLQRMVDRYYDEALTPKMIQAELSALSEEFRNTADAASDFKELYPTERF